MGVIYFLFFCICTIYVNLISFIHALRSIYINKGLVETANKISDKIYY